MGSDISRIESDEPITVSLETLLIRLQESENARNQSEAENDMCVNQLGEAEERAAQAEAERDRMREALDLACDWIDSADLEDENGRSVAIQLRTVLTALPAPEERETPPETGERKTCWWKKAVCIGIPEYRYFITSCSTVGGEHLGVPGLGMPMPEKCPRCGLPIEEVKGEEDGK